MSAAAMNLKPSEAHSSTLHKQLAEVRLQAPLLDSSTDRRSTKHL
jgi:hypothetical protein